MIGHKWEPAQGTILQCYDTFSGLPARHGAHVKEVYEVEVGLPDGTTDRAQVPSTEYRNLSPGTIIRLEVNAKTAEIRLHPHAGQLVVGFNSSVSATADGFAERWRSSPAC